MDHDIQLRERRGTASTTTSNSEDAPPKMTSIRRRWPWRPVFAALGLATLLLWLFMYSRGRNLRAVPVKLEERPKVILRQGRYIGLNLGKDYPRTIEAFFGLPYGLSTAGLGRFRAPVRVDASELEFDASHYGDGCPSGGGGEKRQSENCLNLNLYRQKTRNSGDNLPVLVHFHGGAFNFGPGVASWDVSHLTAWSAEPMIAISFNYRVGALGFLPSKLMAEEGLLNAGLKDQELLLEWVQENIAAFGGDPDNVTIMGSSAGAHSVGHHLFHNLDHPPPFARAIIESGAATARAVYTPSNPIHEKQFRDFVTLLGCDSVPDDRLVTTLRGYSTAEIQSASNTIFQRYNPSIRWPFQPVIEPKGIIAMPPISAWKAGKWHKVPILTGFNTNEGSFFVPSNMETNFEFINFFKTLLPSLSAKDILDLQDTYPDPLTHPHSKFVEKRPNLGAQFTRLEQAYGHFAYIAPIRQTVHYAASGPAPVYLYHFAATSSAQNGATHASNSAFVMHSPGVKDKSHMLNEISGTMHAYWTSFITSGDPNKVLGRYPVRRKWPKYRNGTRNGRILVFGEGNDEVAGGKERGVVVQTKDDGFAADESIYWWNRTELFEV